MLITFGIQTVLGVLFLKNFVILKTSPFQIIRIIMLGFTSMVTYSIQLVSPCATLSSQLHTLFHTLVKIQCIVGVSLSNTEYINFTITLP